MLSQLYQSSEYTFKFQYTPNLIDFQKQEVYKYKSPLLQHPPLQITFTQPQFPFHMPSPILNNSIPSSNSLPSTNQINQSIDLSTKKNKTKSKKKKKKAHPSHNFFSDFIRALRSYIKEQQCQNTMSSSVLNIFQNFISVSKTKTNVYTSKKGFQKFLYLNKDKPEIKQQLLIFIKISKLYQKKPQYPQYLLALQSQINSGKFKRVYYNSH